MPETQSEKNSTGPIDNVSAFLSHSSKDKPFVRAVAKRLGRVQVFLDEWNLETGDRFTEVLPEALKTRQVFVLFASKASLESFWVTFETKHARHLYQSEVIRAALVFIIDDEVRHDDLPKWMQRGLVKKITSAQAVARIIHNQLNALRGLEQQEYFFGRDELSRNFSRKLVPDVDMQPPHTLIVGGLSGMGRRTFVKRALQDNLSMRLGPVFHLRSGDGLDALQLALMIEVDALQDRTELSDQLNVFRSGTIEEQVASITCLLANVGVNNVAPCIVDDGSLLLSTGQYTPEGIALIESVARIPEIVLVLIQPRLPFMSRERLLELGACMERVGQLDSTATRLLLTRRLRDSKVDVTNDQLERLSSFVSGYPPAINLAATYAKDYGIATLLLDTVTLTNFQSQTFADVLRNLKLGSVEWGVLRLLSAGLELPVEGLMAATQQDAEIIVSAVKRLVDFSLILPQGDNFTITYPIRYAVHALQGPIPPEEFSIIGKNLKAEYWDGAEDLPDYGILESTIYSLLQSSDADLSDFKSFVVPSMLFRSAKNFYQLSGNDNWISGRRLLLKLLEIDPVHRGGLSLLTKIEIRLQDWSGAARTLAKVKKINIQEQHFLEGFLLWKQRKFAAAIPHFRTALRLGQKALDIYHALATCLLRLDQLPEAKKVIEEGLKGRSREFAMLVDLAAVVAIKSGDLDEAEPYIESLRRMGATDDYHHRKATLLSARKRPDEALPFARLAAQAHSNRRQRFEIEATLINILIDLKKFEEAEDRLDHLDKKYKAELSRRDVRLGLRCKLLLRQDNWREAEPIWKELEEKNNPVHEGLRRELLEQKTKDRLLGKEERELAKAELSSMLSGSEDISDLLLNEDREADEPELAIGESAEA